MTTKNLFSHILTNTAIAGFTNMLLWFAITFWVFLSTRSVMATGILGGIYLVFNLFSGIYFGSLVDHNRKKSIMLASSTASLILYAIATIVYFSLPLSTWQNISNIWLWVFIVIAMAWILMGNIRMIALSTIVTILIPEWDRDKANGKVWAVNGLVFTVVSVFSGLIIGQLGMEWALMIVVGVTLIVILHLMTLSFPREDHLEDRHEDDKKIDITGTIKIIAWISGLFAMIFFAMWNNFLGWVFMALMDAYGLSIVSVEVWGMTLAITSMGFILWGTLVARYGLGGNPVKTLLVMNLITWSVCIWFPLISSIYLVGIGFFLWMVFGPMIEASEQTILQKVVPLERQWRVFGFGQSMENIASPLTAFLVGPLTELLVMPWVRAWGMNALVWDWWGTSDERAMAVVFVLAGLLWVTITLLAFWSKSYRNLSKNYTA